MNRSDITEAPSDIDAVASVGDGSIKMVNGYSIGCGLDGVNVGDVVEHWGYGIGYPVRGQAVGGRVDWYRTEQEDQDHQDQLRRERAEQKALDFEESRPRLDAEFEELPSELQERIQKFRDAGGERWRIDFESYEMLCSTDAVKIMSWCSANEKGVSEFRDMPYGEQLSAGLNDGHSGNSFGMACFLAERCLNDLPIIGVPGALSPLSGDRASGIYEEASEGES